MSTPPSGPGYGALVPVKPPAVAKSRLQTLGDDARIALVVAFALDTIGAAMGCPLVDQVLVITDDYLLARGLNDLGALVIPDGTSGDLNGSLVLAAAEMHRRSPGLRLVALCADLPALRSDELTRALAAAPDERASFVADADGVGTTAVLAPNLAAFRPMFGHGSRQAHLDAGAWEIDLVDVPTLRRDVDTPDDLTAALELGVGSHTARVAAGLRL